jgi:peptidoglycan/xylan/chitin deacetylase (PgdA/CDA1 family)
MKHFLRNSFIYIVDVCGVSALYRFFVRRQGALVRIVVFHDIADGVWFEEVLAMFKQRYNVISPDDFHTKKFHSKKINVVLTFDDGYDSWVSTCVPLLKKYGVKGLFFITTGILDTAGDVEENKSFMKDRLYIAPKEPLTWNGVEVLIAEGHSIGGHTHTHRNIATLSLEEAREEIVVNKEKLEAKIGHSIVDFAYPFGKTEHRSDAVLALLSEVGYTSVYTATSGAALVEEKQTEIPRMCIEKNQPISSIERWIAGGYDVFSKLHTMCDNLVSK